MTCTTCGGTLVVSHEAGDLGGGPAAEREPVTAVEGATGRRLTVERVTAGAAGGWLELALTEHGARVAAGLNHPGVVRVVRCGLDRDGALLIVREPLDGGTLEERLRCQHRRLDRQAFRQLLESLLRTLAYLHALVPPVIHRGVCPAAIAFRTEADWRPVLTGLPAIAPPPWHPAASCVVGQPGYAAPEQLLGEWSPAADLYAVGATMLFAATHTDPLDLPRRNGRFRLGERLSVIEPEVRAVLLKLAEPDVRYRYQSADEALTDLGRWSRQPRARRPARPVITPAFGWYASAFVWLALILVPLFVMLILAVTHEPPPFPPPRPPAIKVGQVLPGAPPLTASACSARTSA